MDADAGEAALTAFEAGDWGRKHPRSARAGAAPGPRSSRLSAFVDEVRRILYPTNSIEALNARLRRAVRARGRFPGDDAALKLLFLVLNRAEKERTMPQPAWSMAKTRFAALFGERFIRAMA